MGAQNYVDERKYSMKQVVDLDGQKRCFVGLEVADVKFVSVFRLRICLRMTAGREGPIPSVAVVCRSTGRQRMHRRNSAQI